MGESIENKVIGLLKAVEEQYHRLVLIVGKDDSGKTTLIRNLAKLHHTDPININLIISKELLELTEKQRQLKLSEILLQAVKSNGDKVFLDNTEILFDVKLKQDPLRLLQGLSRNLTIVATWNGIIEKGKLAYAEQGHREFRRYDIADICFVSMNKEAKVEFIQSSQDKLI